MLKFFILHCNFSSVMNADGTNFCWEIDRLVITITYSVGLAKIITVLFAGRRSGEVHSILGPKVASNTLQTPNKILPMGHVIAGKRKILRTNMLMIANVARILDK